MFIWQGLFIRTWSLPRNGPVDAEVRKKSTRGTAEDTEEAKKGPVTHRISVERQKEFLEGKMIALNRTWERFLLTFSLREAAPDVRLQLRARLPLKKKTAEQFQYVQLIKIGKDSAVKSGVPPELRGGVARLWSAPVGRGQRKRPFGVPLVLTERRGAA